MRRRHGSQAETLANRYQPIDPVISTYAVADRTQVADIDPSMLVEDLDDDLDSQPCPVCGDDDNEELLLGCDGCDAWYHTYCVDLDDVPPGHWFCDACVTQRAHESVCPVRPAQHSHNTADRRTRGQQRRLRNRNQASASSWARVWQVVWDQLNFDLDFPFDEGSNRDQRSLSQRRDFRQWERRFQIAERQGGANRFRDTASALLDLRAPREKPELPEPESREEIRAWNALEKAKEIEAEPVANNRRKRKSTTASPSDAEPKPERRLKRPRTRRTLDIAESSSDAMARPTASRRSSRPGPSSASSSRHRLSPDITLNTNGPSFLQSLLKEVESSAAPDETKGQVRPLQPSALVPRGRSASQVSSPGASPTSSNHNSPRALSITPPPFPSTRPGSPVGLTSKVEPIFPPPEFSPTRSPLPESSLSLRQSSDRRPSISERRRMRPWDKRSPGSSPPRSDDTSPSRINMSLSAKEDVQKLVAAALKPHYKSNAVSKDQYTDINRNISRMLYDKVGDTGNLNGDARETWETFANHEVAKAVESLKVNT